MESFEIKNLFTLHGHSGLFLIKAGLRAGYLFVRLTDPDKKVLVKDRNKMTQLSNIGVYVKDQEDPNTLESVIDTMYTMSDSGVTIPTDLTNLGDRWPTVADLMQEVVPNYDDTRFKPYHMEKILKWYHEIVIALADVDEVEVEESVPEFDAMEGEDFNTPVDGPIIIE